MASARLGSVIVLIAFACSSCSSNEKMESIPLDSVVSTTGQPEMKRFRQVHPLFKAQKSAPDLILVRAKDVQGVIKHLTDYGSGGMIVLPKTDDQKKPWLVVYLGTRGSEPPVWTIAAIHRDSNRIRVSYRQNRHGIESTDQHPYYAFVPLADLKVGKQILELFDADGSETVVTRRVEVNPQEQ